jgi:hypothetical protein
MILNLALTSNYKPQCSFPPWTVTLMVKANSEIQTSMTESLSKKKLEEKPILTNPVLLSGSLDQGVALHF